MTGVDTNDTATTCARYFEAFLPGLRGQLLIPGLHSLSCALGVALRESGEARWTLRIVSGVLSEVVARIEGADCVFHLDADTLLGIVSGNLRPDLAFFDMRVEIEGDIVLGLQLSTVLGPFFQTHPFSGSST